MKNALTARLAKTRRLQAGGAPRVLELCSGCGGLTLGMQAAGFDLVAHLEADPSAAASYALNFAPPPNSNRANWKRAQDMVQLHPLTISGELGLPGDSIEQFDVLAAGLPCQAFARIGRSKLRSVTGDSHAFKKDPRAGLYERFLLYVSCLQPVAILLENVPDILNFGGRNIPEEISETLDELGYTTRYTLLNAAAYGVPQMRERLFLVALDKSFNRVPSFPSPTNRVTIPKGYGTARSFALRRVPAEGSHFVPTPPPVGRLPKGISVSDALTDLPRITEHYKQPDLMKRRRRTDKLPHRVTKDLSDFACRMRTWRSREPMMATDGHVVRITPRDFEIFARMAPGDDYPIAFKIAEQLLEEKMSAFRRRPSPGSDNYLKLRKSVVPPYDHNKFPNKWWKLVPTLPSRTLTAHMGKDTYSHIHWDSSQRRTISVREAARLQSFPDCFQFDGAMNAAFKQIGNAVPPLLAEAVSKALLTDLMIATQQHRKSRPSKQLEISFNLVR